MRFGLLTEERAEVEAAKDVPQEEGHARVVRDTAERLARRAAPLFQRMQQLLTGYVVKFKWARAEGRGP